MTRAAQHPLLRLLVAAAFLTFVVGLSPHLVHHLFEPDAGAEACAFAAAGERAHPIVGPTVSLVAAAAPIAAVAVPAASVVPAAESGSPAVRAPPTAA
jgi:hypothetical protein